MTSIDIAEESWRARLPQLKGNGLFVTDGGLETDLVFHDGIDLPCFAAFPLLDHPDHRARLRRYYDGYLDIAREHGAGFIVETPTCRSPDWAEQLGYSSARLDETNRAAVALQKRSVLPRRPMASPPWSAAASAHVVTATTPAAR